MELLQLILIGCVPGIIASLIVTAIMHRRERLVRKKLEQCLKSAKEVNDLLSESNSFWMGLHEK